MADVTRERTRRRYVVTIPLTSSQERNFWAKVLIGDGCWEWTGAKLSGYGRFGQTWWAHRLAYELLIGPIPDGLELDHVCRNHGCVNPSPLHLEPVTGRVNTLRGETLPAANLAKKHCPQGHPYSGDNLSLYKGFRMCRACKRAAGARLRRRLGKPERQFRVPRCAV